MPKSFSRGEIRKILGDAHTDDIENALVALHIGVVDQLKDERDRYKAEAEKLPDLQKELENIKGEDFKAKYENEHTAFEDYKAKIAREANEAKIKAAYRDLLSDCKVSDKRLDAICKVTDFSDMKLDKDGNLADPDKLKEAIKKDWSEFITQTQVRGVSVETPPDNGKPQLSRADILAIKDTAERQKAIADNHNLFGF